MYPPKKQLLLGRREEFANPIYILRTWDVTRRNVASGDQTDRMMKVGASLPSKGEGIKNKVQSIPLKTEVRPTGERRTWSYSSHRAWFGNYCYGRNGEGQ